MRRAAQTAALLVVAAGFGSVAAAQVAGVDYTARQAAIQPYYPAKAAADGVEGDAMLSCDRADNAALVNCRVVAERPAGGGFGAAALQIAAQTQGAELVTGAKRFGEPFTFQFRLHPMMITPNLLARPHIITNPGIAKRVSAEEFSAAYPKPAGAKGLGGLATLSCRVTFDGHLTDCTAKEDPAGWGFSEAALSLAPGFLFHPLTLDGIPIGGGKINIPIRFNAPVPPPPPAPK
jgi:TonB family protein